MIKSPLKIILFGEHSILEGGRCLLVAINKFATIIEMKNTDIVCIRDERGSTLYVSIKDNGLCFSPQDLSNTSTISVDSYFGSGLGTSASICLLLSFFKSKNEDKKVSSDTARDGFVRAENIFNRAIEYEHSFHGRSSGADVNGCFFGDCISFENSKVEFVKSAHLKQYKLIIFDSTISKMTKDNTSSNIKNQKANRNILKNVAEKAHQLLKTDFTLLEMYLLIREAQDTLENMNLVPEKMKLEVRRLRNMNIESKITGGGCGGHLFTFVEKETVIDGWKEVEIDSFGFKTRIMDYISQNE